MEQKIIAKDLSNFDWGWMDIPSDEKILYKNKTYELNHYHKILMIKEIFEDKTYEKVYPIKEGDIVVDIGASVGPFTYSILDKKPGHVYCLEPSNDEFISLSNNLPYDNVTLINRGISHSNTSVKGDKLFVPNDNGKMKAITFSSLLKKYKIKHIDFLKTDCEGGEYHIFRDENMDFLLNKVGCIVGEWHLSNSLSKTEFRYFRDKYLPQFKNIQVYSVDGIDIKWDLYNDHFIEYYNQVLFHISNK